MILCQEFQLNASEMKFLGLNKMMTYEACFTGAGNSTPSKSFASTWQSPSLLCHGTNGAIFDVATPLASLRKFIGPFEGGGKGGKCGRSLDGLPKEELVHKLA